MLRLMKYLKPYLLMIIIAIGLLFIQANADLALPDYLSKIVNDGIQQGGVVNAIPKAIRQSEMDKLVVFFSPSDKQSVLNAYTLYDSSSPGYDKYAKEYPALGGRVRVCFEIHDQSRDQTPEHRDGQGAALGFLPSNR